MEKLIIIQTLNGNVTEELLNQYKAMLLKYRKESKFYLAESQLAGTQLRLLLGNQAAKDAYDELSRAADRMGQKI